MWRMLTGRAQDLEVRLAEHEADAERGSAHWLADYTFSTGRRVHNDIRAEFRFENGLIAEHRDSFSFYAWARQALGPAGLALGWTPLMRGKVQREERAGLDEFLAATGAPAREGPSKRAHAVVLRVPRRGRSAAAGPGNLRAPPGVHRA